MKPKIRSKWDPGPKTKKKSEQKNVVYKAMAKGYDCREIHGVRVCSTCNIHWNRDVNAARNLLHMFQNGYTFRTTHTLKRRLKNPPFIMSLSEACPPIQILKPDLKTNVISFK